jgi:hypothetical protein
MHAPCSSCQLRLARSLEIPSQRGFSVIAPQYEHQFSPFIFFIKPLDTFLSWKYILSLILIKSVLVWTILHLSFIPL